MSTVLDVLEDLVWHDVPQQALDMYEKVAEEAEGEWEKAAYSPTLRRMSEILQFAPAPEGGTLPSRPGPLASMLASGLVGGGLGYGLGWLGEKFLPAKWKRGRMRRTGAILGALFGASPGLMWGITNKLDKRKFNDPTLLDTHREDIGKGFPPVPEYRHGLSPDASEYMTGRVAQLPSDASNDDVVEWLKHSADVSVAARQYVYSTKDALKSWEHDLPKKMLRTYIKKFGQPDEMGAKNATWYDMAGFDKTVIVDEEIAHELPAEHIDFVYSTKKIKVKPADIGVLAKSSGSILVDQLKGEVTARCHYLIKNAVTLGFVADVASGKISSADARKVYAKRILNNIIPSWFEDPLDEYKKTLMKGEHHFATNSLKKHAIDLNLFGGTGPIIPVNAFNTTINRDPRVRNRLDPAMRAAATGLITSAAHLPGKRSTRFVTPMDVGRMAAGMGSGYLSGALVGKALGVMMGMPESTQNRLKNTGMFAGVIANMVPIAFGT